MANEFLSRYCDTVGDGSGFIVANGDYSDTGDGVTDFLLQPEPSEMIALARLIVYIQDVVTGQFDPAKYGDLAALTNGIEVLITNAAGTTIKDLTDSVPIKSNAGWARLCYDVNGFAGGSNASVAVRWTFDRAIPQGYDQVEKTPLVLQDQQKFVVRLNDDLDGLTDHTFLIQGVTLNSPANLAD